MYSIIVTDSITGKIKEVGIAPSLNDATGIASHLNHLNEYAAQVSGKAVKFIYSILEKIT